MLRALAIVLAVGILQQAPAFSDTAVIGSFTRIDPGYQHYETLYKQPIDDRQFLLIVRAARQPIGWHGRPDELPWGPDELLGVFLMDRRDATRVAELLVLTDHTRPGNRISSGRYSGVLQVDHADATTLVLDPAEFDPWGGIYSIKLVFDAASKRLIKRLDFPAANSARILRADDRLCAALTVGQGDIRTGEMPARQICVEDRGPVDRGAIVFTRKVADVAMPADLPPLPQSSYDDFAKARPERVKDGYRRDLTRIEERVTVWQRTANRIWFGRAFYDGEGLTGVGDLGYFETTSRQFTFLRLPEMAPWSTSALLIEGDVAWVGLLGDYEGPTRSNGLLRVDVRNRQTRRYEVQPVIRQIVRWNGVAYLATENGLFTLRGDRLTRYRFEPMLTGDLAIVTQPR
jgi:hypothetical protein